MHCRIATWNLDRSGIRETSRIPRQLAKIRQVNADLWILTETHATIAIDEYEGRATREEHGYHQANESCAAIWSRWPILGDIKTYNCTAAVCAEIQLPVRRMKMIVYASIMTYGGDVAWGFKPWDKHRNAVREQCKDWIRIGRQPCDTMCVAGDFNENLDGSRWYGLKESKKLITDSLVAAGLKCATAMDMREKGMLKTRASVDHVCLSSHLRATRVEAWEGTVNGAKLSDHNGVFVDLELPDA